MQELFTLFNEYLQMFFNTVKCVVITHYSVQYFFIVEDYRNMIKFKIDALKALAEKGYNTNRIRKEKIISEGTLQRIRNNKGEPISTATLDTICKLLKKQPSQIIEYVEEEL